MTKPTSRRGPYKARSKSIRVTVQHDEERSNKLARALTRAGLEQARREAEARLAHEARRSAAKGGSHA